MRCTGIDITLRIPTHTNSYGTGICKIDCFKDNNGVVYEIESIKGACEQAENIPIVKCDKNGKRSVIGVANRLEYKGGYLVVTGSLFAGGTAEEVVFTSTGDVTSMDIESIELDG